MKIALLGTRGSSNIWGVAQFPVSFTRGEWMSEKMVELETLKDVPFEKVIRQVLEQRQQLTIRVSDDEEVVIDPKPRLKPLPVLDGYVPEGWKDAIYDAS